MTYTVLANSEQREDWLVARSVGVGASETPALLGLTNYASPVSMWAIKTGRVVDDDDAGTNDRMRWGNLLEPIVAEEYERQTGRVVQRWGDLLRSDEFPYILATPDYWTEIGGVRIPVEIKTTDIGNRGNWADGPPENVVCQMQQQMLVTGAPMASTGVLLGGNSFRWADVERDEEMIARIVQADTEFWRYVEADQSPPMDGSGPTTDAVKRMWPFAAEGETIVLPDDVYDWIRELDEAKAAAKEADTRVKTIENTIKAALGNAEIGLYPEGDIAFTYKTQHRKEYVAKASSYRVLRKVAK